MSHNKDVVGGSTALIDPPAVEKVDFLRPWSLQGQVGICPLLWEKKTSSCFGPPALAGDPLDQCPFLLIPLADIPLGKLLEKPVPHSLANLLTSCATTDSGPLPPVSAVRTQ